ncbi:MAG: DUF3180 domain-containing protein [Mycobacteriales bacterium]
MTPTRPGMLLGTVAAFAVLGYLLIELAYGSLPALPLYAPVTLVLLALVEAGTARVVRDRLAGRGGARSRPLHPLQIARAAVLAKASSVTGAVLLGGYGGLLAWTLPRRDELALADRDAGVAGVSVLACLGLVVAALLLERSCRTPENRGSDDRQP